ncbi:MAG: magnesium transporter CorA family protein [Candidatus Gastranaerophilales bacterium]|nr:magnesium transporter CorA family protein [Candidatus Gastranaerophilales bacterium]
MIKIFKTNDDKKLSKLSISEAVSGSWFSLISPNEEEIKQVSLVLGLDEDFLLNSLDLDERSRIETADGNVLIITNLPIMTDDGCFDTLPLGIIYTPTSIITVCSKDNNILSSFNETTSYFFDTRNKTEFMLKILFRSVKFYLKYLDIINRTTENIENELQKATNNKALFQLMEIQKTLVYFSTALKDNDIVLQKIMRMTKPTALNYLKTTEEDIDLLEDVIIDTRQAIEMVDMHRMILEAMMEGFASIINNNLNLVMKFLAAITIIMSIPTMIGGLWGMNVIVPYGNNPYGFMIVVTLSIILSIAVVVFFRKKGMF